VAQVVYLDLPGHGRSEWGDPASWSFELCGDAVCDFCDALGIARPVVYGHSLGSMVALVYAARHPGHAAALVLQSAMGRFDLDRIVEGFRRAEGDDVTAIAERVYGGDSRSVTQEEWAACWRLFGPSVPGDEERARTVVNVELNAVGLELMRGFDVLDQLGRVDSPTLVCVGELDPVTPVAAAREIAGVLPAGSVRLEVLEGAGPLHLEGCAGSLLAASYGVRDRSYRGGRLARSPAGRCSQGWIRLIFPGARSGHCSSRTSFLHPPSSSAPWRSSGARAGCWGRSWSTKAT
jgi:proline iminopeptidase